MSLHSFSRPLVTVGSIAVSGFVVATAAAQANPPIIVNCNGGGQILYIGGNWQQGNHTIQIGAIGRQGGCNAGTLGSWGVQVRPAVVPR